jgi:ClpP class serine protease
MDDVAKPADDLKPIADLGTAEAPKPADEAKQPDKASMAYPIGFIKDPFDEDAFKKAQDEHLEALQKLYGLDKYTVLFLLDEIDDLASWHSNRLYKAASKAKSEKPILLIVHSRGGSIEDGYLISKTCKRLSKDRFVVAVPRKAKSAATLLSLGADEIHMGLMSQLGPIDPQIRGWPAQAIKNALQIISDLACKHPDAAKMLGQYLAEKLDLNILGYFERINESAQQYAERLLMGKALAPDKTASGLASHFVNHYKDHGFVIDFDEARSLLGDKMVKQESTEYQFANSIFESFDLVRFVLGFVANKDADLVGDIGGTRVFDKKK